ncbi:carbohydrate binding domain-containing protein [Micromonospora sp. PLK6-60]|uniref:carbohydrate binding domain-containing protein n=1 Tax=Micromonospora sp. PLK6-60 TaxID=2873383 RepID=UPI001CA68EB9|nr:carbohydrate binding domain-containing protein [Micromonospora sp. PLK6-60]MBY8872688.1 carbohydrate binding domain-containing protein [Micromonospora sp. PLK6-60]
MSNRRDRRAGYRRTVAVAAALLLGALAGVSPPAQAADRAFVNGSFESGLTGWKQFGVGGNTVTTEKASDGSTSLKIADGSTETGTGLETAGTASTPAMQVVAGASYTAFAKFWVDEEATPQLYLRFYDANGGYLTSAITAFSGTRGGWSPIRVTGTAPTGSAFMSVLPYSSGGSKGTFYVDEVAVSNQGESVYVGAQVDAGQVNASTFGIGTDQNKVYGVFTGSSDTTNNPAKLATVDVDTNAVVDTPQKLPGAAGGWAATTATDGSVYVGTYHNAGLYRYLPGTKSLISLGSAVPESKESYVWDLAPGRGGRIYGGTYNTAGFFSYAPGDPGDTITTVGSVPFWPGKTYVRALAFDPESGQTGHTGRTFLGVGTPAALLSYDRDSGKTYDITVGGHADEATVGGMTWTGNRLFVVWGSGKLSVLRVDENANGVPSAVEEATFANSALTVAPARDGKVYVMSSNQLKVYDIANPGAGLTGVTDGAGQPIGTFLTVNSLGWVQMKATSLPGETLVVVGHGSDGKSYLFKYNPTTNWSETREIAGAPLLAMDISAIGTGPDGRIYSGGFLTGGIGVYQPIRGDAAEITPDAPTRRGVTQAETITTQGSRMYIGAYPHAKVYEYDPARPWNCPRQGNAVLRCTGLPESNPRELPLDLGSKDNYQDRPYAITTGGGKLFVGTVPKSNSHRGALTVANLDGSAAEVKVDFVPDQSVVSLVYLNGKLYGGSSIRGGLGVEQKPTQSCAEFFVYDPVTKQKTVPSPCLGRSALADKITAITALAEVGGKIWGIGEGYLFVYDPATNKVTSVESILDINYDNGIYEDAKLLTIPQDTANVYGLAGDTLFKINRSTRKLTVLDTNVGAEHLASDSWGNLYYTKNHRLYRFTP